MRDVSAVINELGEKWNTLSKEQQQNTIINVAGTYQQNRLSAVLNNYKMSVDATTTALESQGSAMREQEKYNQSLEARINRLDTAWTSFSKSVGDTVLYDGIVVATSALEAMTDKGNGVVSTIGLLPPAITVATVAVYAFSGSFRALTLRTYEQASATISATGATGMFSGALVGLRTVAGLATVALKGLAIATGIGVAFAVVGVVIEKLTNIISDNIQKQEEFDTYLKNNSSALTDNREAVEGLIKKYDELSSAKENGNAWDSTKEEEYLKVQKRLGELYPALIAYTDASGQAHLKTSEEIKKEVNVTNELIEAQNKLTLAEAISEFEKLNDAVSGGRFDSFDNFINGSLEARIKGTKDLIELMKKQGDTDLVAKYELQLLKLEQQVVDTSDQIKGKMLEVANAVDNVKIDPAIAKDMENFLRGLDVSNLDNAQLKDFSTEFGKLQTQLQEAINSDDKSLYQETVNSINELAKSTNNADFKKFKKDYDDIIKSISDGKNAIVNAEADIEGLGEGAEQSSESVSELASKMKDFKDVTEQMAGVSQLGVDALNDLIFQYDSLTNKLAGYTQQQLQDIYTKENLTSKERDVKKVLDDRVAIMKELSAVYPDLLGKDGKAIVLSDEKRSAIIAENKANEILLKGYKLARDGKLTAEQQATLASASGAKARINNLKTEIQMLEKYVRANEIALGSAIAINAMPLSGVAGSAMKMAMEAQQSILQGRLAGARAELDGLASNLSTNIGYISDFSAEIENSSKSTSSNTKATKENNAEKEKSIWITDKYKQKLEELNLAIEKQQKIQARFPEHSKEYRKSLEVQIKLEKEKLALQEKQVKAIQAQIASGKIQQTGNVSVNSSNGKINGFDGKISSGYGERSDNHRGVDIAMPTGTRVDSPVNGKVIKAGSATSDKNGKKMDWSYGNLVVIEDKNGIRHLLAHLDETLVKVGDQVQAGTQIGKSGNTGNSTGAHLHYEQNNSKGQTINPTATLNAIRSNSSSTSSASSQQAMVWNYFKNKGLNDNAIAGLMGNIQQESGFNSSSVNKSSGASGIFQWLGGRKTGLQDYAKSVGKSWTDLQVQLDYAWKELQSTEKKSLTSLQRSDLPTSQHASEFERLFERSGGSQVAKRQNYANQYYNQFAGTSGSAGVGIDTTQQAIDQAKSDLNGLQKDVLNSRETIENLNDILVKANVAYYDDLIEGIDRSINESNVLAEQQLEYSQAYRDELEKQTKHLKYKQSLLHKEANYIREQLKRTDISPAYKDELTTQLSELSLAWWDVDESLKSVNEQIENSKIAQFEKEIEDLNDVISQSNALMGMYAKGSKEYNNEQKKIISALYDKQKAYEAEAEALRKSIQMDKLSIKQLEEKKERLKELSSTWLDIQSEIVSINADIADELISTMKEAYEQQRDYELALKDQQIKDLEELRDARLKALDEEAKAYEQSIKEQMDELDKAHKDKLDKLNKESKAFEDAINRQLKLMREQRDEDSFNKDIGKLQKEEADIVAKINELAMDDSREGQLKKKKLEEELANIREQIAEKQNDRQYELREQNLQDELDAYKTGQEAKQEQEDENYNTAKEALDKQLELYNKDLEAKKKLEEDKFKATKDQLDKERQSIVSHYDSLINNEKEYVNLRAQIINGSVDGMNEKLSSFLNDFKSKNKDLITDLGMSWQELENKIYRITQMQGNLGNVSTPNPNVDLMDDSTLTSSDTNTARDNAWQQYLYNKQSWESASKSEKARLSSENEKLRKLWGFRDGSYDELKNLKKYHSGGIVGGKGNRLSELTNKLFNTKPNEETVLALKKELFVPEHNISNMFTNIRSAMPDFKMNNPQGNTIRIDNLLSIDNVSQNANLDIDRLLDQSMNRLIDKMKPYGFRM